MVKEFIEGAHFKKNEKHTERYYDYLRNKYQSKAFQLGILSGTSSVLLFWKKNRSYSNFSKIVYSINLFLLTYIFTYEIWSRMYTDKNKVHILDQKLLS